MRFMIRLVALAVPLSVALWALAQNKPGGGTGWGSEVQQPARRSVNRQKPFPPTYVLHNIPVGKRIIDKYPAPQTGCACGIHEDNLAENSIPSDLKTIYVDPKSLQVRVGQAFSITFDASYICKGQTIRDLQGHPEPANQDLFPVANPITVGTVEWDSEVVRGLTVTYGTLVLPDGYPNAGTRTIRLEMNLQCYDSYKNCIHACDRIVTVPVTVTP